jgi:DNA-binding MarR family transcriptional regulator
MAELLLGERGRSWMPEEQRQRRPRKATSSQSTAAALGVVRVPPDFTEEFPDGDPSAAEVVATLIRAGLSIYDELDRGMQASFGVSEGVLQCLAVIDGAESPLTPSQISERTFRSTATMTSLLDALEREGWARRIPNPDDRRSVLVEITDEGRALADQFLPGVRKVERLFVEDLTEKERSTVLNILAKVLDATARLNAADPIPFDGQRNRPVRLS